MRAKHKRPRQVIDKPETLDDLKTVLHRWLTRKRLELEHSTIIGYTRIVQNILIPRIGKIALRDFDRVQVREQAASFGSEVTAKRINNVLGPLRGALGDAVDDDLINANPLDGFKSRAG